MDAELRRLLDRPTIAHVATVLPDGAPHSVPVWVGVEGDRAVFFTGPTSRKARNLAADPRVAISLTEGGGRTMAALRGRVVDVVDGEAGWAIVDRVSEKYSGGPYPRTDERVAYLIDVDWSSTHTF